jgi:hypothetical protein
MIQSWLFPTLTGQNAERISQKVPESLPHTRSRSGFLGFFSLSRSFVHERVFAVKHSLEFFFRQDAFAWAAFRAHSERVVVTGGSPSFNISDHREYAHECVHRARRDVILLVPMYPLLDNGT